MKRLLLVLAALLCVSCAKEGTRVPSENAKDNFHIEFLFECDGLRVYRFFDCGDYRYFAIGNGKMINSTNMEHVGNTATCHNDAVIQ